MLHEGNRSKAFRCSQPHINSVSFQEINQVDWLFEFACKVMPRISCCRDDGSRFTVANACRSWRRFFSLGCPSIKDTPDTRHHLVRAVSP